MQPTQHVTVRSQAELDQIMTTHRWSGLSTLPVGLARANFRHANFRYAKLSLVQFRSTDLSYTDCSRADFSGGNFISSNFSFADLHLVNFRGADLRFANFHDTIASSADFSGANLKSANIHSANFNGANFTGAKISRADFSDTDLSDEQIAQADTSDIVADLYGAIDQVPQDIPGLIAALRAGCVNGSTYHDDCGMGCLAGTIEIAHGSRDAIPEFPRDENSPRERWFLAILPGMTPGNSAIVRWTIRILEARLAFHNHSAQS